MKKLIFTFLFVFLSTTVYAQRAECNTDEFTGETVCSSEPIKVINKSNDVDGMVMHFAYIQKSDLYAMYITSVSEEWQWIKYNTDTIHMLVDGERITLKIVFKDQSTNSEGYSFQVVETIGAAISESTIQKLYGADEVKFKVDDDVGIIGNKVKSAALRLFDVSKKL